MALEAEVQKSLQKLEGINFLAEAERWGLKLLGAVLILLFGVWLVRHLTKVLDRAFERAHMEATLRGFLRNIAYATMLVIVVVAALQSLGVPTTSVMAALGAAGLAIGLALKDSLSNIASGVMLIVQRPFHVGDTVQAAGIEGTVELVRVFQTRMRTADNRSVIIPNSLITTAPIINFTANSKRRVDIKVGVGYQDDLRVAREILLALADEHPKVLREPKAEVLVLNLSESSVDLELRAWVATDDLVRVRSELTEGVRDRLIGRGLNIPYPQRDLHVYHRDADGRPLAELLARSVVDDGDLRNKR
ncbi:mechanosensitive ion channel family protein [Aerolutibacter ruishenii]|uniref:Small-conductance mechanosensitive channel n=1 Tax=Aerolutibacter ruishenii TaxID=686800 RepID=A0A562LVA3_9GAMM|nr:mechanosensitive ion channel family protein [Lysobacter ruishenii]TWI11570.1 mechanosensitive ion channel-like protein [Lysobacter ruishenii]